MSRQKVVVRAKRKEIKASQVWGFSCLEPWATFLRRCTGSSIKSGLFTRPLGRYIKKIILHSKCLRLIEVCREVNRLLALVIGYAAAVAWVTHWKCPFSNGESKVIDVAVSPERSTFLCAESLLNRAAAGLVHPLHLLQFSCLFRINVMLQCTESFHSALK